MRQRINRQVIRNLPAKPAVLIVHRVLQPERQNVAAQFKLDPLPQLFHSRSSFLPHLVTHRIVPASSWREDIASSR